MGEGREGSPSREISLKGGAEIRIRVPRQLQPYQETRRRELLREGAPEIHIAILSSLAKYNTYAQGSSVEPDRKELLGCDKFVGCFGLSTIQGDSELDHPK